MPSQVPDLWGGCYDGPARQTLSPEQFKKTFCEVCTNPGCKNSRGAGTGWMRRMLTQEDRLLDNPDFADPDDPRFLAIRNLPFEDMIREALAIEISNRKGDWAIPTETEIGRAAAELAGMSKPASFQVEMPEPRPPERLVDEVKVSDHDFEEKEGAEGEALDTAPSKPDGHWRIRGDSGTIYEVTVLSGQWECTCPSRENPCKHVRDIARKLARAAPSPPRAAKAPPALPPAPNPPSGAPRPFQPSAMNTRTPDEGLMIDGSPPPSSEEEPPDPWAPPPEPKRKDRVIPVGGKVQFSRKK